MTTKHCPRCEEHLQLTEFGRNKQSPDGLNYYCKGCATEKQRLWGRDNPERRRAIRQRYLQRLATLNQGRNPYQDDNRNDDLQPA